MSDTDFQKLLIENMFSYINEHYPDKEKRDKIIALYTRPNLPSLLNYSYLHGGSEVYLDESNTDRIRKKIAEDKIIKEVEQYRREIELEIDGIDGIDDDDDGNINSKSNKKILVPEKVTGEYDINKYNHSHHHSQASVNSKRINSSSKHNHNNNNNDTNQVKYDDASYNTKIKDDTTYNNNIKMINDDTSNVIGSLQDVNLSCRDCSNKFIFSIGEQEFFRSKGFDNKPTRCKLCNYMKKSRMKDSNGDIGYGDRVDRGGTRSGSSVEGYNIRDTGNTLFDFSSLSRGYYCNYNTKKKNTMSK